MLRGYTGCSGGNADYISNDPNPNPSHLTCSIGGVWHNLQIQYPTSEDACSVICGVYKKPSPDALYRYSGVNPTDACLPIITFTRANRKVELWKSNGDTGPISLLKLPSMYFYGMLWYAIVGHVFSIHVTMAQGCVSREWAMRSLSM